MTIKIKNLVLQNNVFVAPMAGVTDLAYRLILREFNAGLVYTEMISDKGLLYHNKKTLEMVEIKEYERPIALQIFGSDLDSIVKADRYIDQNTDCDIIDINMGCPVPKVTKTGAGAKLMTTPEHAYKVVKAIVDVVEKPVSVKIRIGWDHQNINAVSFAKKMEEAGASMIVVHGRTKSDLYSGKVNKEVIKAVKEAVKIPVIANGDIKMPEDAKEMLEFTGCDGVMIGRALLGNPWLIKQTLDYLETGNYEKSISNQTRKKFLLKHLDNLVLYKGEKIAVLEMRSHGAWYLKGLPSATIAKQAMANAMTIEEVKAIINTYLD